MDILILYEVNLVVILIICLIYWFVDISYVFDDDSGFIFFYIILCLS